MEQDWASLSMFIMLQSLHNYHGILDYFPENYSQSQATSDNITMHDYKCFIDTGIP